MEAVSPDGVVEAVRVTTSETFAIGVQWHPESLCGSDPLSVRLFQAFGAAVRERSGRRARSSRAA